MLLRKIEIAFAADILKHQQEFCVLSNISLLIFSFDTRTCLHDDE